MDLGDPREIERRGVGVVEHQLADKIAGNLVHVSGGREVYPGPPHGTVQFLDRQRDVAHLSPTRPGRSLQG
eukprot:2466291-Prymnesium_polylepis.1